MRPQIHSLTVAKLTQPPVEFKEYTDAQLMLMTDSFALRNLSLTQLRYRDTL